jgi:hypothetical protein
MLFSKFANAIVGDGESIVRPEGTRALDLEVELGVVISRRTRRVTEAEAMDHVAGYVVVNDVSARDWQGNPQALREGEKGDGQWLRAKGSDTFLPVGPVFVTRDELDPADGLRLRSWRIPGRGPDAGSPLLMQDGNTSDLVRVPPSCAHLAHHPGARRHRGHRDTVGGRRVPRPAGLPRAGRSRPLRDRRDRHGGESSRRLERPGRLTRATVVMEVWFDARARQGQPRSRARAQGRTPAGDRHQ